MRICINKIKMRLFHRFVLEKHLIWKSWNLIGWEYFGLYFWRKIFLKYRICSGTQQIMKIFIIEQIQWKLMTKVFFKLKKPQLLAQSWSIFPIFRQKVFPETWAMHNFIRVSSTKPKLMIQSNDLILRKHPDRWDEGRMDRPYFTGSFWILMEVSCTWQLQ